jgi:hypothetical protein
VLAASLHGVDQFSCRLRTSFRCRLTDGHPTAAEIIQAMDPVRLTASLSAAPAEGDTLSYGDVSLIPTRDYR